MIRAAVVLVATTAARHRKPPPPSYEKVVDCSKIVPASVLAKHFPNAGAVTPITVSTNRDAVVCSFNGGTVSSDCSSPEQLDERFFGQKDYAPVHGLGRRAWSNARLENQRLFLPTNPKIGCLSTVMVVDAQADKATPLAADIDASLR